MGAAACTTSVSTSCSNNYRDSPSVFCEQKQPRVHQKYLLQPSKLIGCDCFSFE